MKMSMKPIVLAALVVASSGAAYATGDGGDNSMTPWYGDSWADVQAHNPEAVPVPSLQAQEDAAEARAAWGQTRNRMATGMHRWRENTTNTFHRMTGTAAGTDAGMSGSSTGYGGSGTSTTTGSMGSSGSMGSTGSDRSTSSSAATGSSGSSTADARGNSVPSGSSGTASGMTDTSGAAGAAGTAPGGGTGAEAYGTRRATPDRAP